MLQYRLLIHSILDYVKLNIREMNTLNKSILLCINDSELYKKWIWTCISSHNFHYFILYHNYAFLCALTAFIIITVICPAFVVWNIHHAHITIHVRSVIQTTVQFQWACNSYSLLKFNIHDPKPFTLVLNTRNSKIFCLVLKSSVFYMNLKELLLIASLV
jgi:hypothetical protein